MADLPSLLLQHSIPSSSPEELREFIRQRLSESQASSGNHIAQHEIVELVDNLPRLTEEQLVSLGYRDSLCPICFTPFLALLAEEEAAAAMDSPAFPVDELGVTRLAQEWQCGHLFCRRDISKWIRGPHDSCPTCRRLLLKRDSEQTPSSSTESNSPTPVPEGLLGEIESQLTALLSADSPSPGDQLQQRLSRTSIPDDHEYVGMYS